jgi:hypothetical protein
VPTHRVGLRDALRLARGFVRVSLKAGFHRRTGRLYWQTLFLVLMRNPAAIDAAVNLAAMYLHSTKQSHYVVGVLEKAARHVGRVGEAHYNAAMLAGTAPGMSGGVPAHKCLVLVPRMSWSRPYSFWPLGMSLPLTTDGQWLPANCRHTRWQIGRTLTAHGRRHRRFQDEDHRLEDR